MRSSATPLSHCCSVRSSPDTSAGTPFLHLTQDLCPRLPDPDLSGTCQGCWSFAKRNEPWTQQHQGVTTSLVTPSLRYSYKLTPLHNPRLGASPSTCRLRRLQLTPCGLLPQTHPERLSWTIPELPLDPAGLVIPRYALHPCTPRLRGPQFPHYAFASYRYSLTPLNKPRRLR